MLYDKVDNENQGLECIVRHYEHVVCLLQGRQHVMKCQQSVVVVLSGRSNALISRWDCWTVWQRGGIITSLDTELNSFLPKNEADIGEINPHLKMIF